MLLDAALATQLVILYQKKKLIEPPGDDGQLTNHDNGVNQFDGNSLNTLRR